MPQTRSYNRKKHYKRRATLARRVMKKRRSKKRSTSLRKVSTFKSLVPNRKVLKLRYTEQFIMPSTGNRSNYYFKGNSLFDPNATGTGHQPKYFDQLALLYTKYRVLKAKCSVTSFRGNGAAQRSPAHVLMITDNPLAADLSAAYTYPEVIERGINYTKSKWQKAQFQTIITGADNEMLAQGDVPQKLSVSRTVSSSKWMKDQSTDAKYAGFGSDPGVIWYFMISTLAIDDAYSYDWTDTIITVSMEYTAEFVEPILIGES